MSTDVPTNYALALAIFAAVALLLIMPGFCLNALLPRGRKLRSAFIPLPGFALLIAAGLLFWLSAGRGAAGIVAALLIIELTALVGLVWRRGHIRASFGDQGPGPFLLWILVAGSALATGLNPLPIVQEYPSGNAMPSRMVASPDDHTIPYMTASYMFYGYDGKYRSDEYFGGQWSIASRGPLVPLAVSALFRVFHAHPSDPPDLTSGSWPVTPEGAFLARSFGWLTNSLVVIGVGHLLIALGAHRRSWKIGLAWASLAPVTLIDTAFVWPKLLAAFFVLMALAAVIEAEWAAAGILTGLAWLSHPVGALLIPPIGGLLLWRALSRGLAGRASLSVAAWASLSYGAALGLTMVPWLAYKAWLGRNDPLLDYILMAGDGRTIFDGLDEWIRVRVDNVWNTLVPGWFYASGEMRDWIGGPLSDPLRWTVQYAKTLPGELGFSMFWIAYLAIVYPTRRSSLRALRLIGVLATLALMFIFWGYSADGLGRNCLEPVPYIAIAVAAAAVPVPRFVLWFGLVGIFLEGRWIEFSGFAGVPDFTLWKASIASWFSWLISTALQAAVIVWAARDGAEVSHPDEARLAEVVPQSVHPTLR